LICASAGSHGIIAGLPVEDAPATVAVIAFPGPVAVPFEAPLLAHAGMLPTTRPAASIAMNRMRIA
jgi:hypothetical protein